MSFNNFLAGPLEKATSSTASDAWATSARFGDVQTLVLSGFERDEDYKPTRVETSRLLETARAFAAALSKARRGRYAVKRDPHYPRCFVYVDVSAWPEFEPYPPAVTRELLRREVRVLD